MNLKHVKGPVMLLAASVIWGFAFAAQSSGMNYIGPFAFSAARSYLGAFVLIPVILMLEPVCSNRLWIKGGLICGLCLSGAMTLQQMGLVYTAAGKSGFLTALYILFVPLIGSFFGKRISKNTKIGIASALAGFYFLCVKQSFQIEKTDGLLIGCAVIFAVHILVIDYYSPKTSGVRMSMVQFLVAGTFNLILMLMAETPSLLDFKSAWGSIAYAGIMSSGAAYTLQILGQKHTKPAQASLIMSLESVFSVFGGWMFLNEALTLKELLGCAFIFAGIIAAQLTPKEKTHGKELL